MARVSGENLHGLGAAILWAGPVFVWAGTGIKEHQNEDDEPANIRNEIYQEQPAGDILVVKTPDRDRKTWDERIYIEDPRQYREE